MNIFPPGRYVKDKHKLFSNS